MSTIKVNAIRPITDTKITVSSDVAITGSGTTTSGSTTIKGGLVVINGPGGIIIQPDNEIIPNQNPNIRITGSLNVSGSVFFTGLIPCTSSNYVLGYNPITGRVCYTASCCGSGSVDQHPIDILGTSYYSRGAGASTTGFNQTQSIFIGVGAGTRAVGAYQSIFLGSYAGQDADDAYNSNFLGAFAGLNSSKSNYSNFIGFSAGADAIYADNSNFFGNQAGSNASYAAFSNLIGFQAGWNPGIGSIGPNNIIIGTNISLSPSRKDSINIGGIIFGTGSFSDTKVNPFSGSAAGRIGINEPLPTHNFQVSGTVAFPNLTTTSQNNIVTIDTATGRLYYTASSAIGGGEDIHPVSVSGSTLYSRPLPVNTTNFSKQYSVLLGAGAGANTLGVNQMVAIGLTAGADASYAHQSVMIGGSAGMYAPYADNSVFLGFNAGRNSDSASFSIFAGHGAGSASPESSYSTIFGWNAGSGTRNSGNVIRMGTNSGIASHNSPGAISIGTLSAQNTVSSSDAVMIGSLCGLWSSNAYQSVFIGPFAGASSPGTYYTVAIGSSAGGDSDLAHSSVFVGRLAGNASPGANNAVFIGTEAGASAGVTGYASAVKSIGIGYQAAYVTFNASNLIAIGEQAGHKAFVSSKSILIGTKAGYADPGVGPDSIGTNNIIIGTNITLPANTRDSINIGGIVFATGSYSNEMSSPVSGSMPNARVGITVANPTARLHIGASTTAAALMRLEVGPAPTSPNDGDIWLESNSNTGLKIRINGVTKTITLS